MHDATLCVLVRKETSEILLGMKKRGFGSGRWNGFGGKKSSQETIEEAAVRELYEEAGVSVSVPLLKKAAELTFYFSQKPEWNQIVYVYLIAQWDGLPRESEEMKPEWFKVSAIPYSQMWPDDKYWLPLVLEGKKVTATFYFGDDNESIIDYKLSSR